MHFSSELKVLEVDQMAEDLGTSEQSVLGSGKGV